MFEYLDRSTMYKKHSPSQIPVGVKLVSAILIGCALVAPIFISTASRSNADDLARVPIFFSSGELFFDHPEIVPAGNLHGQQSEIEQLEAPGPEKSSRNYLNSDLESEFKEFLQQAKLGDDHAQRVVAYLYETGEGVTKDLKQARLWYRRSAEQGNGEAQWFLGSMFEEGIGGEMNQEAADYWFDRAKANQLYIRDRNQNCPGKQMSSSMKSIEIAIIR